MLPEENLNSQSKEHQLENSGQSPAKHDFIKSGKNSRKRKSIIDAVRSVEHLYSEGKKWQIRVEGKLSDLHGMLKNQVDKSLQEKSNVEQHPEQIRVKKRKNESPVEEVTLQLFDDSYNCKDRLETGGTEEANVYNKIIEPTREAVHTCENGMGDFCRRCFIEKIRGNYMKLLDLDDAAAEERYCRAAERPLSPFVPVIELQISDTNGHGSGNHECHHGGLFTEKENVVAEDVTNNKNCEGSTVYEDTASAKHILESDELMGLSDICRSGYNVTCMSDQSALQITSANPPKYYVVFSDSEDGSSISKIYCAIKMCMDHCSMTFEKDETMPRFLLASLKMGDLSPRERALVVFSVLLNSSELTKQVWNSWPANVIQLSVSFAGCLRTVLSDAEARTSFSEMCFSGELLTLIENFLLDGRLLVHTGISSESSRLTGLRVDLLLNEEHMTLSLALPSRCQLLFGSVILASICAATDRFAFLCEASHNILRLHKSDKLLVLDILHVFAYVCGPKFFTLEDYSLTMTVVRSLVAILGRESTARGNVCCRPSIVEVHRKFPSCIKCPFSEDTVSMDVVICLLLEKLKNYASSGVTRRYVVPGNHEDIMQNFEAHCSCSITRSPNCCLNEFGMVTCRSTSICDGTFCHCADVISLVELIASNMHWDWTCNNIVPRMLKMLDGCVVGDFFTIIVVFLGKLGRLGVDAGGYDDKGVGSLRSRLSALLYHNSFKELAFTTQIAVISALVGTIPLDIEKLLKTDAEIPLIAIYLDFANCIRNWYSTLNNEQQSWSLKFLESVSEFSCRAV